MKNKIKTYMQLRHELEVLKTKKAETEDSIMADFKKAGVKTYDFETHLITVRETPDYASKYSARDQKMIEDMQKDMKNARDDAKERVIKRGVKIPVNKTLAVITKKV